jgi:prevent-host-death family protein
MEALVSRPSTTQWTIASAKARFSELVDKANREGPQVVTRNGHAAVVLVSPEEWARKTTRKGTLAEFLMNSPLRGSDIDLTREDHPPRDPDL